MTLPQQNCGWNCCSPNGQHHIQKWLVGCIRSPLNEGRTFLPGLSSLRNWGLRSTADIGSKLEDLSILQGWSFNTNTQEADAGESVQGQSLLHIVWAWLGSHETLLQKTKKQKKDHSWDVSKTNSTGSSSRIGLWLPAPQQHTTVCSLVPDALTSSSHLHRHQNPVRQTYKKHPCKYIF